MRQFFFYGLSCLDLIGPLIEIDLNGPFDWCDLPFVNCLSSAVDFTKYQATNPKRRAILFGRLVSCTRFAQLFFQMALGKC